MVVALEWLWKETSEDWITVRMSVTGCCKIATDWLEHGAEPPFSSWTDLSILLQRNRVTYSRGVVLSRGLGSDKKASILASRLCTVIHQCSLFLHGRRRAHIGSTKTLWISPPQRTGRPKQQHRPYLRIPLTLCYFVVAERSIWKQS